MVLHRAFPARGALRIYSGAILDSNSQHQLRRLYDFLNSTACSWSPTEEEEEEKIKHISESSTSAVP